VDLEFFTNYPGGGAGSYLQAYDRTGAGAYQPMAYLAESHEFGQGPVGIGTSPTRSTFDLTAKEQLAEWKTRAKASTWSEVTDGEFSQEPTEDLVAQWIETRAAGDKLQVKGNISSTGTVTADKISSFVMGAGLGDTFTLNGKPQPQYGINWNMAGNSPVGMSGYFGLSFATGGAEQFSIAGDGHATFSGGSFSPADAGQWTKAAITTRASYGGGIALVDGSAGFGIWAQEQGKQLVMGYGPTSGTVASDFVLKSDASATFRGNVTVGNALVINGSNGDIKKVDASGVRYEVDSWVPIKSDGGFGGVQLGLQSQKFTDGWFSGTINGTRMTQDGAPVIDAKGLINTLTTLRNATKDETTLEGMRDALADAIGGLIENLEHEIATMPAPEPEIETMPVPGEETE
jgi:hypothetical protein